MVRTPWHDAPVPFEEAAETGTHRVITEHATVGMLVTTDGSIGDLQRENYAAAEERVAAELTQAGKPFAVILNSARPDSEEAVSLAERLETKYGAPVALVSCAELDAEDFRQILGMIADEFPAKEAEVILPGWSAALPEGDRFRGAVRNAVREAAGRLKKLSDARGAFAVALEEAVNRAVSAEGDYPEKASVVPELTDAGKGTAVLRLTLPEGLYYDTVSEMTGIPVKNEEELIAALNRLAASAREFERYREAIDAVNGEGYGIVMPDPDSLELKEPEILRQGGGWGVRLRATAPSIHMIRADIDAEISPIVGTEQQSEATVKQLMQDFENDPSGLWESNMFGKSLYDLLADGLHAKLDHLPPDARKKLGETLAKIINEGSQGLICIIL
jgi:stage IV sporulation protein A